MPIKKGDKVRLKSGGPIMIAGNVYRAVDWEERAECEWFDSNNIPRKKIFYLAALELV